MRGHARFWIIFFVGAAICAGVVWLTTQIFDGLSFDQDGPRLVFFLLLGTVIGSSLLLGRRIGIGEAARSIGIWVLIGLLLVAGYAYRAEITAVWNRIVGAVSPGSTVTTGDRRFVITLSNDSHFYANAKLNGADVRMLVDTGATTTAIPPEAARKAGLDPARLTYDVTINTANGQAKAAFARLRTLSIGPVVLRDVKVIVKQRTGGTPVLGMSTLRRFRKVTLDGERLIIDW